VKSSTVLSVKVYEVLCHRIKERDSHWSVNTHPNMKVKCEIFNSFSFLPSFELSLWPQLSKCREYRCKTSLT